MDEPYPMAPEEELLVFDHLRAEDGEHVGYIGMTPEGGFVPMDRMRRRRGEPMELEDAEALLDEMGLRHLTEPWHLRQSDGTWVPVRIAEIRRDAVVVCRVLDEGSASLAGTVDLTATIELALPTDRLVPAADRKD